MSGWKSYKLGECISLLSGGTPSKARAEYWDGSIPWVSAKDMKSFWIDDSQDRLTDLGAKNATRLVPPGTTLMLVRGMTLHNDVPVCRLKKVSSFNQDVKAVSAKGPLLPTLLPHLLVAIKPKLLTAVDSAGHGTGRLQTDSLFNIDIVLPCPDSQEQIAELAEAIENKIELNRQINQTLEQIAQTIFKSWFVDFEPVKAKIEAKAVGRDPERAAMCAISGKLEPELDQLSPEQYQQLAATAALFPDELVESELGLIPVGWEPQRLESLLDLSYGKSLTKTERKDGYVPVYGSGGITGCHISSLVSGPGIIIGRKGTVGALYWEDRDFFAIDTVFYVVPKNGATLEGLFYLLQTLGLEKMNTDAAVPGLNRNNVYRLPVPKYPKKLMEAFSTTVGTIREKIFCGLREVETLATLRDTLLPKLLSGELTVEKLPLEATA